MILLVKFILGVCLSAMITENNQKEIPHNYIPAEKVSVKIVDSTKTKAFTILSNKFNICHLKRNKRRVFTIENMNPWAVDIYKQVFIKKRMPKGKQIALNSQEYKDLLTWITSAKNL